MNKKGRRFYGCKKNKPKYIDEDDNEIWIDNTFYVTEAITRAVLRLTSVTDVDFLEGVPCEYTTDLFLFIDNNGADDFAIVMRRVINVGNEYIPDESGDVVEYLINGEHQPHYDSPKDLNKIVLGSGRLPQGYKPKPLF